MGELPLHPYSKYTENALKIIHGADKVIPIMAMTYTLLLFSLYCVQYKRRRKWYSIATLPLHTMAIISLFILFIFASFMYILSTDNYTSLPPFVNSCSEFITLLTILFVFSKYIISLCIISNLSQIIQNPFINPRYKYIGKKRRIRLKYIFRVTILILILFFIPSVYGAWTFGSTQFTNDGKKYCTPHFNTSSFFWLFTDDILFVVVFVITFGRNAFSFCRLAVRPKQKSKYMVGDLSATSGYDDSKHSDYNKIIYAEDDPIIQCIKTEIYCGNPLLSDPMTEPMITANSTSIQEKATVSVVSAKKNDFSDLIVNINEDDNFALNMEKDQKSIKLLRDSTLIEAEELITNEEIMGLREQKRVVTLMWILIVSFWISVLLFISYGLFQSAMSVMAMIAGTVILLFNDFEFGSTYWQHRRIVCSVWASICCLCKETWFCNECFCGNEKVYKDNFNEIRNGDAIVMEHQKFLRL